MSAFLVRRFKEGIIEGAIMHGSDGQGEGGLPGYFYWLAHRYPKAFSHLLGRLMPLQINGAVGSYIGAVNIVQVPQGQYLSPDQIATHYPQLPAAPAKYIGDPPEDTRPNAELIPFQRNDR